MFSGVYSVLHPLPSDGIVHCYIACWGSGDSWAATADRPAKPTRTAAAAGRRLLARHREPGDVNLGRLLLDGAWTEDAGLQNFEDYVPADALLIDHLKAIDDDDDRAEIPEGGTPEEARVRFTDIRHLLRRPAEDPARNYPR